MTAVGTLHQSIQGSLMLQEMRHVGPLVVSSQVLFWLVDRLIDVMDFGPIRQAGALRSSLGVSVAHVPFKLHQTHMLTTW